MLMKFNEIIIQNNIWRKIDRTYLDVFIRDFTDTDKIKYKYLFRK